MAEPGHVAFFLTEEERGRLEDVDCYPVTKGELEKNFARDLDAIRAKIKKIRAESSTEEMVHRILKKTFAEQTNDLESSDFDSYFFKCRAGKEEWRLVWCCGYQRADLEPLRARLWQTPDGEFLGVRPPDGGKAKRRKRRGPLAILESPLALLLLLLLLGGFFYLGWPTLKVTPQAWTGPLGSRIEYKVTDHRWLLFKRDVTLRALAESHDPRVVEFGRGPVADTRSVGATFISFRVGNRFVDAEVDVTKPAPPDTLTIEPDKDVYVAVGSTKKLKAMGHYENNVVVDLTTQVTWEESGGDKRLLVVSSSDPGLIQGDGSGTTKVVATLPGAPPGRLDRRGEHRRGRRRGRLHLAGRQAAAGQVRRESEQPGGSQRHRQGGQGIHVDRLVPVEAEGRSDERRDGRRRVPGRQGRRLGSTEGDLRRAG